MTDQQTKAVSTKILIVEDSAIQALVLRRILEKEGYSVSMAKNGVEGLAAARELVPELIITDIMMPKMDGFQMCRQIKDTAELKDIPVILLTSLSDPRDVISGLKCGADNFINKPFNENYLLSRIRYILLSRELFEGVRTQMGIEIYFDGEKHLITSDRQQILNLLLSTYEAAVHKNTEIIIANEALQTEIAQRKKVEEELQILFRVSTALSHLTDMESMFKEVFSILLDIKAINIEQKGIVLLKNNDSLSCAYAIGHDEEFIAGHKDIKLGTCLCGIVAQTGEVIICGDSHADDLHSLVFTGEPAHCDIVIPLKSSSRLMGVLCLSIRRNKNIKVDDKTVEMLQIIGNEIGVAVENARLFAEAQNDAFHDVLTGLPNRRLLEIITKKLFASAQRGMAFSMIIFDIDHFKKYNDTHGHLAGDNVLISVSNVAKRHLREMSFIARWGGEEFVVILPETDVEAAISIAERLRLAIETETEVTVSLGISTYHSGIMTMEEMTKAADVALYAAKENGRNNAVGPL